MNRRKAPIPNPLDEDEEMDIANLLRIKDLTKPGINKKTIEKKAPPIPRKPSEEKPALQLNNTSRRPVKAPPPPPHCLPDEESDGEQTYWKENDNPPPEVPSGRREKPPRRNLPPTPERPIRPMERKTVKPPLIPREAGRFAQDSDTDPEDADVDIKVNVDKISMNSSDSDSDCERSDYMTVVSEMTRNNTIIKGKRKSLSSRGTAEFSEIKNAIIEAETVFIKKYTTTTQNSSFLIIFGKSKATARKIYGDAKEMLQFHFEFRSQILSSSSPLELAEIFTSNEDKLRMHISDQWKLSQSEDPEVIMNLYNAVYGDDFPSASENLITSHKEQVRRLCDLDKNGSNLETLEHAKQILINIFKQIIYINIALKTVKDSSINLSDCGDVLLMGRYHMKRPRRTMTRWKMMDIFLMERYIILVMKKKDDLNFIASLPTNSINFNIKQKENIVNILPGEEKKIWVSIKFSKEMETDFSQMIATLRRLTEV